MHLLRGVSEQFRWGLEFKGLSMGAWGVKFKPILFLRAAPLTRDAVILKFTNMLSSALVSNSRLKSQDLNSR